MKCGEEIFSDGSRVLCLLAMRGALGSAELDSVSLMQEVLSRKFDRGGKSAGEDEDERGRISGLARFPILLRNSSNWIFARRRAWFSRENVTCHSSY